MKLPEFAALEDGQVLGSGIGRAIMGEVYSRVRAELQDAARPLGGLAWEAVAHL